MRPKNFITVFFCLSVCSLFAGRLPTPEEAGISKKLETTVAGHIILKSGQCSMVRMEKHGHTEIDTRKPVGGVWLRSESPGWTVFGPGTVVKQSGDSATIKASGNGKGYLQGHRYCYYKDSQGVERKGVLIQTWILVVNAEGRIVSDDNRPDGSSFGGAPPVRPDIPKAVIKGRAVMRGTSDGVAGANIELQGDKTGLVRGQWRTDASGNFQITTDRLSSSDRYEVFIRKPSTDVEKEDAFLGDLWPVYKYYVSPNENNCLNLDVGIIELASAGSLWGTWSKPGEGGDREVVDRTPKPVSKKPSKPGKPGQPGSAGAASSGGAPGTTPKTPPSSDPTKNPPDDDTGESPPPADPEAQEEKPIMITAGKTMDGVIVDDPTSTAKTLTVTYKGYVGVDFNLKATMSLKFEGSSVTGELNAPAVSGRNIRLPGALMKLSGKLSGTWEENGKISGDCSGQIIWPGSGNEDRKGSFNIKRVGKEIHFQSTGFYYNKYIFEAQGVEFTASAGGGSGNSNVVTSLVILIDASNSMQGNKIAAAKTTAVKRIAALKPETELAIIAFSGNAVKLPFTVMDAAGCARAQEAVNKISVSGGTPLAAGIHEAGQYLRRNASGKNLGLIVLSDGEETAGGDPPAEVRRLNDMSISW